MKTNVIAVALLSALTLGGCATSGNQALGSADQSTIDQRIVAGKTTKRDVQAYLGGPDSINLTDGGQEVWQYSHAKTSVNAASYIPIVGLFAGGSTVDQKILTILFDKKGVVVKSAYGAKVDEYRNGISR